VEYPPFEPPLSTDLLTSVALTGTNHAEDQPIHLRVAKTRKYVEELSKKLGNTAVGAGYGAVQSMGENDVEQEAVEKSRKDVEEEVETRNNHIKVNLGEYAGLLGRACPAGVYEYVLDEGGSEPQGTWNGHKLVINSQVRLASSHGLRSPANPFLELYSL